MAVVHPHAPVAQERLDEQQPQGEEEEVAFIWGFHYNFTNHNFRKTNMFTLFLNHIARGAKFKFLSFSFFEFTVFPFSMFVFFVFSLIHSW